MVAIWRERQPRKVPSAIMSFHTETHNTNQELNAGLQSNSDFVHTVVDHEIEKKVERNARTTFLLFAVLTRFVFCRMIPYISFGM